MTAGVRKLALTVHVVCSVGWLGAVATFLALAIVALTSEDAETVRAVYVAAEPITWFVLVPLAFASLVTGLVQSLGTPWGLFRHYWVLFKLLINVLATALLLLYTETVDFFADLAASSPDLDRLDGATFALHSAAALALLLVATVLAVYKPKGMTAYGRRKRDGLPIRT